jgi:hypothetical protein
MLGTPNRRPESRIPAFFVRPLAEYSRIASIPSIFSDAHLLNRTVMIKVHDVHCSAIAWVSSL